jgi:N-acetylglutamate synthase
MLIRKMKESDYDEVVNIWQEAGLDYMPNGRDSRDAIGKQISCPCSVILVSEHEGRIIGVVLGTHDFRKGWINRLAVLPEYQGQGVAKSLIKHVEQDFIKTGIKIFSATIFADNSVSLHTAEKMGYILHENVKYLSKKIDPYY